MFILDELLYYDEIIVKAGVNVVGNEQYQKLVSEKKKVVADSSWITSIKNHKLLRPYLQLYAKTYRTAIAGLNLSQENVHQTKEEDLVNYKIPGKSPSMKQRFEPTETGDIMKRLQANQLRTEEWSPTEAIVKRISKMDRGMTREDKTSRSRTPTKAEQSNFKYLKDHDLEEYYKSVFPKEKLPKEAKYKDLPIIPNHDFN